MAEETKQQVTQEQIAAWKEKHSIIYKLVTEDGLECYIKDPCSDFKLMKLVATAMAKSLILAVAAVLNNCWLGGDEEIKTDEKYANGLEDQIADIVDFPESTVERLASKFRITVEGLTCEVRGANRADILLAEQKNKAKEPFETNIQLLNLIKLNGVEKVKENPRAYIGLLIAIDKVKNKAVTNVEKL